MDKKVINVVLECHQKILKEQGIDIDSSPELSMTREYGIDSLGIVTFIIDIEEKLDIDLDDHLIDIRKSETLSDVIKIVEKCAGNT